MVKMLEKVQNIGLMTPSRYFFFIIFIFYFLLFLFTYLFVSFLFFPFLYFIQKN